MPGTDIPLVLTWLVGALFVYSGLMKVQSPERATEIVRAYGVDYAPGAQPGFTVGIAEVALGGFAWVGPSVSRTIWVSSLALILLALSTFTAGQLRSLSLGRIHPCGCFGEETPVSRHTLLRTAAILVVAGLSLVMALRGELPSPLRVAWVGSLLGLTAVAGGLLMTRRFISLDGSTRDS